MNWTPLWRQAHTAGMPLGFKSGKKKTIAFELPVYISGDRIRVVFLNHFGKKSCEVGSIVLKINGVLYPVTKNGKPSIKMPAGSRIISDEIKVKIHENTQMEVRIYMNTGNADSNMTEDSALSHKGNLTMLEELPKIEKPEQMVKTGEYYAVPAIEAIEVYHEKKTKVIAAFGDSLTAMNRWGKPLQKRLYDAYGDEFSFVNEGILGNCLTYEIPGLFQRAFGEKGIKRFDRDMEGIENLHTVIFALCSNDIAFGDEKRKHFLNVDNCILETKRMIEKMRSRNLRVVGMTISPRFGQEKIEFTERMNNDRHIYNEWLLTCGLFDYVLDADAVVRDSDNPEWYDARYHLGDHLHPNDEGGRIIAEAFNLEKLTGQSIKSGML